MAFHAPSIQSVYQSKQVRNPITQIIMVMVVIVLFSWFLFKPKLSTVIAKRQELKSETARLASVDNDKREMDRLIQQLRSAGAQVALTDEALPLSGRTSKPHILFDSLAKSSGMVVVQITPTDTDGIISAGNKAVLQSPFKAQRKLYIDEYNISVTGTIDQYKNFLQLLETNGRVLDVTALEITGGDQTTKFRTKVKAYSFEATPTL